METDLKVIARRLVEVPPASPDPKPPSSYTPGDCGVSRYQRQSAHLRDRDCSIDLTDFDTFGVDLTGD